jgi:hypothetical protein
MTRFRDLLKVGPRSTPGEEQRRASEGLADAVKGSNLHWWEAGGDVPDQGEWLLLAVAPHSQYDLVLLDLLDERLASERPRMPVYVVNLQDYDSPEQLSADFPGVGQMHQTPLVAICQSSSPKKVAWGKKARDLAAEALGLSPDVLSRKVVAESPRYAHPG